MSENHTTQIQEDKIKSLLQKLPLLKLEIQKEIIGQDEILEQIIISLLAGGHCLLEGVPGLAKTLLVKTMAKVLDLNFRRIQFTPDLMPSDIIGTEILEEDSITGKRMFKFNKGPIFANILLADEINRTPPKTQSALLEAMQEFEVTYAGNTYFLEKPFFILATQNPIEQSGTYPLPEAQLDRFLLFIKINYPTEMEEVKILTQTTGKTETKMSAILHAEEIKFAQSLVREVYINQELTGYISSIVRATRPESSDQDFIRDWVRWGASPRAGQAIILTAKASAFLAGRYSVLMEDIHKVIFPVLRHRILVNFKAEAEGVSTDKITSLLLKSIHRPSFK